MSNEQPPRRRKSQDDKQALSDMLHREQPPLRKPPRLVDKPRVALDDTAQRRRSTRYTTTATPRREPLPDHLADPHWDDPAPQRAPLMEATTNLHQAQLIGSSVTRGNLRPALSPLPQAQSVAGRPWLLAMVALISIVVIVITRPQQAAQLSNFFLPSGMETVIRAGEAVQFQPQRQLNTPPGEHSVLGAPTITAELVEAVLAQYGSPAAGTGQIWINLGRRYNIDPAYALAFFVHESSAGSNPAWAGVKPGGATTHNVGNIICAGYPTCYGRFRDYGSWEEGIEDWYKLISREYVDGRGAHTVEQIIPIYAPSIENNVPAYITAVVTMVNEWRGQGGVR